MIAPLRTPEGLEHGCSMYFILSSKFFCLRTHPILVHSLLMRHFLSSNGFLFLFISANALQLSSDCFIFAKRNVNG